MTATREESVTDDQLVRDITDLVSRADLVTPMTIRAGVRVGLFDALASGPLTAAVRGDHRAVVSCGPVDTNSRDGLTEPLHVHLSDWIDAVVVYPCTLHHLSRLTVGSADAPSLLAHASIDVPMVVAPSLPPGVRSPTRTSRQRRLRWWPPLI